MLPMPPVFVSPLSACDRLFNVSHPCFTSLFPSLLFLFPLNLLPVFSPQTPEGEILQRRLSPLLLCSRPCCHHSAYGMCLLVIVSALVFYHISLHFRFEAVLSLFASPSLPFFSLFFTPFFIYFLFHGGFPQLPTLSF